MATLSKGHTFSGGETVTATKLNDLVDSATISNIVNADINASAAIALSKLATGALPTAITVASANLVDGTIVNADVNASAAIDLSKLATGALPTAITVASANLVDGTIVNADVSSSAAIAGSKVAPDFGAQNAVTTGNVTAAKLIPTGSSAAGNGMYLQAANSVGFSTSGSERVRIDSSGNVGIGGLAPQTTLEVRNPTSNTEYLRVGGGSLTERALRFSTFVVAGTNNVGHDLNAPEANGAITLSTASTERLRIKPSGQIRFQPLASDPTGEEAGDVYYNSATNKLRVRTNTAWVDLH